MDQKGWTPLFVITVIAMVSITQSSRILLVVDNPILLDTHTQFISTLKSFASSGDIQIMNPA